MMGVTISSSVSRTMDATWFWFQPLIICSMATRTCSIFFSSAPTSMKTTCA